MNGESPGYDELKVMVNDLQRQLIRSLRLEQKLHDVKDRLDRDLARFKGIQSFNEKAMNAADIREFVQVTVESIIEVFEVSCSAFLSYDQTHDTLTLVDSLGLDESLKGNSLKFWLFSGIMVPEKVPSPRLSQVFMHPLPVKSTSMEN